MIPVKDNYQAAVKPATTRGLTQLGDLHSDKVESTQGIQQTSQRSHASAVGL